MLCFFVALLYADKGLNKYIFLMLHIIMYILFFPIYIFKKGRKQEIILHDAGHYV